MKSRQSNEVVARVDVFAEIRWAMSLAVARIQVEGQCTIVSQILESFLPYVTSFDGFQRVIENLTSTNKLFEPFDGFVIRP
jgi:hypothetical protein